MRGEANFDHLDQAISDLTEAVKLNPNDHEAYFELGNMFNNRADLNKSPADYDKAISALTSAIKLKPDNFCYNQRGIAYLGKGDYQNAIADFKDEHDDTSACNMGAAHFALGDYQQAINDYESGGMFGEPNHEGIAEANYALGNLNEALKNFRASASEGWGLNQVGGISFSRRPFFYVWLIEVEQSQDIQQANKNLSDGLLTHSEYKFDDCMPEIGDYLLNHVSEANLLSKINDAGSKNFDQSKCEAMFFVGMKHLLSSDPIGAKTFFQICVDRGEKAFNGYQFSKARLAHLARDGK